MRILLIFSLIFSPSLLLAGDCIIRQKYYTPPTIHYSTPSHHNYNHHNNYNYKKEIIIVPKILEVEVSNHRDHYYSLDSYYQMLVQAKLIAQELRSIQNPGVQIPSLAPSPNPGIQTPNPGIQTPNPGIQTPNPMSKISDLGNGNGKIDFSKLPADEYQDPELVKDINNSCAKCHSMQTPAGGITFLTADDKLIKLPEDKIWKTFAMVSSGDMPKATDAWKDDQVKRAYKWAKRGK